MNNKNRTIAGLALGAALIAASAIMPAHAQDPMDRPLRIDGPTGLPVIPIMEGAYDNGDGSFTVSFGYLNRNTEEVLNIPHGPNNYIEPAQFDGMQPTRFETRRQTGIFTVTVPASMEGESIWWHIKTPGHEALKVPGRLGKMGYTLDMTPRPQGSLAPIAWYKDGGTKGHDPMGAMAADTVMAKVGEPATLTIHTEDISVRDPNDPRYAEPVPLSVTWWKHQGAGEVTFSLHPSTPEPQPIGTGRRQRMPGDNEVRLDAGKGTANVHATFSEPGDYLIRTQVDNWDASDSSRGDQCCWTNMFQKVTVSR